MASANRWWATARNLGMLAAVLLSTACFTARVPNPPGAPDQRRDFQEAVARLSTTEPDSPATLNARLDYVEYLLKDAAGPDCPFRLATAQSELDAVAASRATAVLFPEGWPRAADAEYRLHRARASCVQDAPSRASERRAALAAARRAVDLYEAALDYHSMAVMQFNVGVTEDLLGDHAAAVEALEAALAMDREFGFRDDARDNYAQLQRLRGSPQGPSQIEAQMRSFPDRSVTLRFAWSPGDAIVSVGDVRKALVNEAAIESHAQDTLRRMVRARTGLDGWVVSYQPLEADGDAGVWPTTASAPDVEYAEFPPALLVYPPIEVRGTGELAGVQNVTVFAALLRSEVEWAIRAHAPAGPHAPSRIAKGIQWTREDFTPEIIAADVTQSYSVETAMWIGATLQQGVWYESQAPLILRGVAPNVVLTHRLQFAYTRSVPCTAHTTERTCAELVIRAVPDADALAAVGGARLHYASESATRLVVDPSSLQPYVHETRGYWYVATRQGRSSGLYVRMDSERETWSITPAQPGSGRS
jgi:tetratricopeptide (TPR) repeat protein